MKEAAMHRPRNRHERQGGLPLACFRNGATRVHGGEHLSGLLLGGAALGGALFGLTDAPQSRLNSVNLVLCQNRRPLRNSGRADAARLSGKTHGPAK